MEIFFYHHLNILINPVTLAILLVLTFWSCSGYRKLRVDGYVLALVLNLPCQSGFRKERIVFVHILSFIYVLQL
jgi:hypothetical protein